MYKASPLAGETGVGTSHPEQSGRRDKGVGLHKACYPGAHPVGAVAYRPAGACGRRP